jgi:DNA-binding NtrC family response regulator
MEDCTALSRAELRSKAGHCGLIGESAPMRHLYDLIAKVSQNASPILLKGETGTGKELVARAIHSMGPRREREFVPLDCSALPAALVESELFGHLKGAFTGADYRKLGLLQTADEGTIFLDEIGELPLFLQVKLLRVLQEKEIRPVGSNERLPINARVIAATNRDLEAGVRAGTFRQDLYYRLKVIEIRLPPLREHKEDISLLVGYFLNKFSDPRHPARSISKEALQRLMDYDWPGNVRELENALERAVALSSEGVLAADDLSSVPCTASVPDADEGKIVNLEEIERRAILRALKETGGGKLAAARILGIGKTTLYRKLKEYARTAKTPT